MFLDALPHRVAVMRRRWDPLYATDHQVIALMDDFQVTEKGLAFEGVVALAKRPALIASTVVRDEVRTRGSISGLRYRVNDAPRFASDFIELAPGTDRRDFLVADPVGEPTLVDLTLDQIEERFGDDPLERRLREEIPYVPRKINLFEHKIDMLLVVARREVDGQRSALIDAFRRATAADIRAAQGDDLREEEHDRLVTELGREPTAEELAESVTARVNALVDEQQEAFVTGELPALLDTAIDRVSRFDVRPDELADLQKRQILFLEGKEIITMRRDDGATTVYFRDHPDGSKADNLLSLPHYSLPYEPPV